jgi:hypothetical protein
MPITTSALPPAYAYVQAHGDLLTQLGATKVEATDSMTVTASFADNAKATNADALLKDTIWGAKLVVANTSGVREPVRVTAEGIADVLSGVQRLHVQTSYSKGLPEGNAIVGAAASDAQLVQNLAELVEPHPAPHVGVWIAFTGRAQDGS